MKRNPVRAAYDFARADIQCPTCGAPPGAFCVQPGAGIERHVPCVARLERRDDPEREGAPSPRLRLVRDPSEPRTTQGGDE